MASDYDKLINVRDLGVTAGLLAAAVLSLLIPPGRWASASSRIAEMLGGSSSKFFRAHEDLGRVASAHPAYRSVDKIGAQIAEAWVETRLQLMDQNLLRRWKPQIRVEGGDHIAAALQERNGVILWVTPTTYSDIIAKMGISLDGFSVNHLSRPGHGFSRTRYGVSCLNRLRTRVEDRYLGGRIRIHKGEEKPAVLAMRRALKKNNIVSITVGAQSARKKHIAMKEGKLKIATGPLRLADMAGSSLLPVFTVREPDESYRVAIHESVIGSTHSESLQRYMDVLEDYIDQYPGQWRGFYDFET